MLSTHVRPARWFSFVVLLASCTSGQDGGSNPGGSQAHVDFVYLYPTQVTLLAGGTQHFDVQVVGTTVARPAVRLYVEGVEGGDGRVGHIDASGLYTAPALPPAPNVVTLAAVSADDPRVKASATIVLHSPPGTAKVVVGPSSVELPHAAISRFSAEVSGTADTRVTWTLELDAPFIDPNGIIDESGTYTAPASGFCHDLVVATSVVDPTARGTAAVRCIPEAPSIASIFPERAATGDFVQIDGTAFYPDAERDLRVVFPGVDGTPIPAMVPRSMRDRTNIALQVPYGATSGHVVVECDYPSGTLRSNGVAFTRIPAIRLLPAALELAAGEQTAVHARVVGAAPPPLRWTAVSGSVSQDGVYSAPAQVSTELVDTITACVDGTPICQSTRVRVHPFLIRPFHRTVAPGGTLQLAASQAVSPAWELWGPGTLDSSGGYSAPTTLQGAGPVGVRATDSGNTQIGWVGVSGVPGEVGRIYDQGPAISRGDSIFSVAVGGNRLYSIVGADGTLPHVFLEVYDITDVTAPVWLDAVETAISPQAMWVDGTRLFLATGDNQGYDRHAAVAIYDVSTDTPVLRRYDRPADPLYAGAARRGNQLFWCTPPATDPAVRCSEYDADVAVRRDYDLPVPAAVTFASMAEMIRIDNLLYLDLTFDRPDADSHLVTFDVSGPEPVQLDVTGLPQAPWFSGFATTPSPIPLVHGSSLFVGASVLDISHGLPVLQSVLSSPRIVEVSGTRAIGLGREGFEMRAFDLTDLKNPVLLSALAMDRYGYFGLEAARLAGEFLLVPSGRAGLAIERFADPGGFLERQMIGDQGSAVFDQTIADGILFMPEAFGDGGELLISDVTKQPATSLARVDLGREQPDAVLHEGNDLVVGTDRALWFFDVTVPATPRLLTRIALPAAAIAKVGTWLFAATVRPDGSPVLAAVDVSTFAAPVVSDLVVLPGLPVKMAAAGSLLYAAADSDGLLVIDVSSPTAALVLAQWKPVPFVEDAALDQTTAFIAAAERGLLIADVGTPSAPVAVSEMPLPRISPGASNRAISLALRRGLVYVGSQGDSGRVFAVDPSNATHPRVVARSRGAGLLSDSFVASFSFFGDEVFYAGWNDDGFGTTEPGVQANDSQPRNVVLLYPAELESTLASGPQLAPADPARRSPLHPKLQPASRWATH